MSVEYGEVEDGGWWRGLALHLAMAAAGALAFTVLVSGVAMREGGTAPSRPAPAQQPSSEPAVSRVLSSYQAPAVWPRMTIYVVESEARARALGAQIAMTPMDVTSQVQHIFVADTREAIDALILMQADVGQLATGTTDIVDLRP